MYSTFNSLGDLLAYCCYRGDEQWFNIVNNLIVQSTLPNRTALMKQSLELRKLYFNTSLPSNPEKNKTACNESNTLTFLVMRFVSIIITARNLKMETMMSYWRSIQFF